MPASQNLQINAWADNRTRVIADLLTKFRYALAGYLTDYAAGGYAALIASDGLGNLAGAQDSRIPITEQQILDSITVATAINTALVTTVIGGVGKTAAAVFDPIQINGAPRG